MVGLITDFLFQKVSILNGVGKQKHDSLRELLGGELTKDLLLHIPAAVVDRTKSPRIEDITSGQIVTYRVIVAKHIVPNRSHPRIPYKVKCYSDIGIITLCFFQANKNYLKQILPVGEERIVSGKAELFHNEITISHPDYIEPVGKIDLVKKLEVVYPLKYGLFNKQIIKWVNQIIQKIDDYPEWHRDDIMEREKWASWKESIKRVHHPKTAKDIDHNQSPFIQRLAYDELLAQQISIQLLRLHHSKSQGKEISGTGLLRKHLNEILPFDLTHNQQEIIGEIINEQKSQLRMLRLLQGDVGSGKTVIALAAMLNAVEAGYQTVLMAPTEILAIQHYEWISKVTSELDVNVVLLTGKLSAAEKRGVLQEIHLGSANLIIGTHALFQDQVEYSNLALAVIDEQHRFGVDQRTKLADKGHKVDMLLMSATPIPRSLIMTQYGDMECSRLTEKPLGRMPIVTKAMPLEKIDSVVEGIRRKIMAGDKVYWVCPLIEESEILDLAAVEERFKELSTIFPQKVGLVHGKISPEEREQTMMSFKNGDIDILVATTVIEVGVDVPQATVIIIEQAERFGLAQLHQLRGRVGRNSEQSSCVLLYNAPLGKIAKDRINILRQTNDGFLIAEEDLRIRGSGDIIGTRQSGVPEYRIADFYEHHTLLRMAHDDARLLLSQDATLQSERGKKVRVLLKLFGYDEYAKKI